MKRNIIPVLAFFVILFPAFYFVRPLIKNLESLRAAAYEVENLRSEKAKLKQQTSWYRWYFGEYQASLRYLQYGVPTSDINDIWAAQKDHFIPIEDVQLGQLCPAPTLATYGNEYIYFGARILPLESLSGKKLYSMSYIGSAKFAHSHKAFDLMVDISSLKPGIHFETKPLGLVQNWLDENPVLDLGFKTERDQGSSAILSFNAGDMDKDGTDDFIFVDQLLLSGKNYSLGLEVDRRSIFLGDNLVSYVNNQLIWFELKDGVLKEIHKVTVNSDADETLPYILFTVDKKVALRTKQGIDIYELKKGKPEMTSTLLGLGPGSVQIGAFGSFYGSKSPMFWISQVDTFTAQPNKRDEVLLISMDKIKEGINNINDLLETKIIGSNTYSDYDGVSTTLSLNAGDIDNDGIPDLVLTGHRHMNEAGALYILLGKDIKKKMVHSVADDHIIKVLGRTLSQLAPPFHHIDNIDLNNDGYDDIIVTADNDLCSGFNAGAILTLDGKKILAEAGRL